MTKAGALPFSHPLREGGAFRGLPVTARLMDLVFESERKAGPAPEKDGAPAFVCGESLGRPSHSKPDRSFKAWHLGLPFPQ